MMYACMAWASSHKIGLHKVQGLSNDLRVAQGRLFKVAGRLAREYRIPVMVRPHFETRLWSMSIPPRNHSSKIKPLKNQSDAWLVNKRINFMWSIALPAIFTDTSSLTRYPIRCPFIIISDSYCFSLAFHSQMTMTSKASG